MKNSINKLIQTRKYVKLSLTILVALFLAFSCRKGVQDVQPIPETHGDSVIFKQTAHPQKITEDPNDNYLFGDSVWVPAPARLVKIGLDVLNTGGYTKKCELRVNGVGIETRGVPVYDTVLKTGDSVFIFQDTISLVKGWNVIKFTGTTHSPASIYFSLHEEHMEFIDTDVPIIGLPLKIKRDWN